MTKLCFGFPLHELSDSANCCTTNNSWTFSESLTDAEAESALLAGPSADAGAESALLAGPCASSDVAAKPTQWNVAYVPSSSVSHSLWA